MKTLCITLHFLDDRFHGKGDDSPEWPPSPFRLFQAMLASSSRNGHIEENVFQWLEKQSAPVILAPQGHKTQKYKNYVPNNDSDKKQDRQGRLAEKTIHPTMFSMECPVHYLWQIISDDQDIAKKAICYAQQLYAVGWGVDLVVGSGRVLSEAETDDLMVHYPGKQWKPVEYGYKVLRCPKPGSFHDLRDAYRSFLQRFEGDVYYPARKPVEFEETAYAMAGVSRRAVTWFKLLRPEKDSGLWASFDQRKIMEISAWVRGCVCQAAIKEGFPGDSKTYVAGHVPIDDKNGKTPHRFSYLPVPSIGHEHADGRVRRFMIAEPYGGNGQYADWARRMMTNVVVKDKNGSQQARLEAMPRPDNVIRHYTHEAKTFQTVTPVILPGYDDRKYEKAEKLLLKAIEQAGFSSEDLDGYYLQKAPFRKGSFGPRSYAVPRYLEGKSSMHVRLFLKEPITGPLAVGAGRHFGLGLFAPVME